MEISDENNCNLIKPTNVQEMGGKKFVVEIRNNRRALGVINQNLVGAHPYPCVVNKRILRNENCDKKPPIPVHRPITRKFAAQMVSTQNHHHPEEIKKIEQSDDVPKHVKQHEGVREQTVAMSMEQTEMILNDKDHMEVEMEDIFEESVMDIDSLDAKNPLAFVDCLEELYAYYRKMENTSCIPPNYMAQQFDINERMRAILIDWLIEVHHKFELREETLFLTVNLIDRFLAKESMVRKKLQLVGLVAMLLACKYEEVSVPVVDDLIFISDKAYSKEEILEMEKLMLNRLQFNMSIPTPYVFMRRFLKAAQADTKLELLSFFFIELCLVEYEMLKYPPSFLAAVAVYTAQCSLYGVVGKWNKTCEFHCRYSGDELLECSRMIVGYHQKAATGKLTGVYRKYSTSKFGFAAKCEPAVQFLV